PETAGEKKLFDCATIRRPVRVEGLGFVIVVRQDCAGASKTMGKEIVAKKIVLINGVIEPGIQGRREFQQSNALDRRAGNDYNLTLDRTFESTCVIVKDLIHSAVGIGQASHNAITTNFETI